MICPPPPSPRPYSHPLPVPRPGIPASIRVPFIAFAPFWSVILYELWHFRGVC